MTVFNNTEIEKHPWDAADKLHANFKLKSSEYSILELGLIFLRSADIEFAKAERKSKAEEPAKVEAVTVKLP